MWHPQNSVLNNYQIFVSISHFFLTFLSTRTPSICVLCSSSLNKMPNREEYVFYFIIIIENSCDVPHLFSPAILSLNFASYMNETNPGLKIATY